MDELQFKRLANWQQTAAQIGCCFERYFEALQLFGNDDNFLVCPDGSVNFVDHAKAQTFDEAAGYEYSPQYWQDREAFVRQHGRWQ